MSDIIRTPEDAYELKDDLAAHYAQMRREFEAKLRLYRGDFTFKVPDGFERHIPSTAFDGIEAAVNYISGLNIRPVVPEKSASGKASKQAGELTVFLRKCKEAISKSDNIDPFRLFVKNLCLYGKAVFKGPFLIDSAIEEQPERMDGEDEDDFKERLERWLWRRHAVFPIVVKAHDPSTVYEDVTFPPRFVVQTYQLKATQIQATWPDWDFRSLGLEPFDNVNWCEYWDKDSRLFWIEHDSGQSYRQIIPEVINGKNVSGIRENIYGFVPFTIAYSGLGINDAEGRPEHMAVGLLDMLDSSIKEEARIKTAISAATQLTAWNNLMMFKDNVPEGFQLDFSPAALNFVPRDNPPVPMNMPRVTSDVYNYLAVIQDEIRRGLLPDSFYGIRTPGVTTGIHEGILSGQGKQRLLAIMHPLLSATADVFSKILQVIDNVMKDELWGVGPSKIHKWYMVECDFDTYTPEEKDRRIMLGANLKGELSWRTRAKDYFGIDNVDDEYKRILVEKAINEHPEVMQMVIQGALRDWGATEYLEAMQSRAKQQASNPPYTTELMTGARETGIRGMRRETPLPQTMGTVAETEGVGRIV